MKISEMMEQTQKEEKEFNDLQRAKCGDYDNPENGCPHCGRSRIMKGADGKHRCEKCAWCIEDRYSQAPLVDEETCYEIAAAIRGQGK